MHGPEVPDESWLAREFVDQALSAGNIGLFSWNLASGEITWSPHHYLIFDVDPGGPAITYDLFRSRVHPDDIDELEAQVKAARASRSSYKHEYRIVRRDGRVRAVIGVGRFVRGLRGEEVCMSGVVLDTTEAHQLRIELAQRVRQLATLVENSPDLIVRLSNDLRLVYVSPVIESYVGLAREHCLNRSILDIGLPAEFAANLAREMALAVQSGQASMVESHLRDSNDQTRYLESRLVPEFAPDGAVESLLTITTDVTAHALTKRALAQSESRLRALADALPPLAWSAHADGYIHWYNQSWYRYTGTTEADMAGWGWQSVHDPALLPLVLDKWKGCIATGEPFEMVFPLKGADGAFRPFLARARPIKNDQGQVEQWVGSNTDISGYGPLTASADPTHAAQP